MNRKLLYGLIFGVGCYAIIFFTVSGKSSIFLPKRIVPESKSFHLPLEYRNGSKIEVQTSQDMRDCEKPGDIDKIRLSRDIPYSGELGIASVLFTDTVGINSMNSGTTSEKGIPSRPGETPSIAHFVWCGKKKFRFEDILGVISIIRILYPQKIIFHYNELPVVEQNVYNLWFQELKQSVPNLVLKKTSVHLTCNTHKPLMFGLEQLAASLGGGILFGERTILTRIPDDIRRSDIASYFTTENETKISRGLVISSKGSINETNVFMSDFEKDVIRHGQKCVTVEEFNKKIKEMSLSSSTIRVSDIPVCILVTEAVYPKDVFNSTTPFGTLARWIYYGERERIQPVKDSSRLIPLISHYVCVKKIGREKPVSWPFDAYVSVLSALYVAGFERVYVHADEQPVGEWWEKLKTENVTFVQIQPMTSVFQQKVNLAAHMADVIRALTILKYGGVYQDWNVWWVNRVPEENRQYETVFSLGWLARPDWPDNLSFGIVMCKPGAEFMRMFVQSFSYYRDDLWAFNGQLLPYKLYERHPDKVYIDRKLQVIHSQGIYHPVWGEGYRRTSFTAPTIDFNWIDISALHFTNDKHRITSYAGIKEDKDLIYEMARRIFSLSGRLKEFDNA